VFTRRHCAAPRAEMGSALAEARSMMVLLLIEQATFGVLTSC